MLICPSDMPSIYKDPGLGYIFTGTSTQLYSNPLNHTVRYSFEGKNAANGLKVTFEFNVASYQCFDAWVQKLLGIPAAILHTQTEPVFSSYAIICGNNGHVVGDEPTSIIPQHARYETDCVADENDVAGPTDVASYDDGGGGGGWILTEVCHGEHVFVNGVWVYDIIEYCEYFEVQMI